MSQGDIRVEWRERPALPSALPMRAMWRALAWDGASFARHLLHAAIGARNGKRGSPLAARQRNPEHAKLGLAILYQLT
jgi:hypothetical protein